MNDNHGTCRFRKHWNPKGVKWPNGLCDHLSEMTENGSESVYPPLDFWCRDFGMKDDAPADIVPPPPPGLE